MRIDVRKPHKLRRGRSYSNTRRSNICALRFKSLEKANSWPANGASDLNVNRFFVGNPLVLRGIEWGYKYYYMHVRTWDCLEIRCWSRSERPCIRPQNGIALHTYTHSSECYERRSSWWERMKTSWQVTDHFLNADLAFTFFQCTTRSSWGIYPCLSLSICIIGNSL